MAVFCDRRVATSFAEIANLLSWSAAWFVPWSIAWSTFCTITAAKKKEKGVLMCKNDNTTRLGNFATVFRSRVTAQAMASSTHSGLHWYHRITMLYFLQGQSMACLFHSGGTILYFGMYLLRPNSPYLATRESHMPAGFVLPALDTKFWCPQYRYC